MINDDTDALQSKADNSPLTTRMSLPVFSNFCPACLLVDFPMVIYLGFSILFVL